MSAMGQKRTSAAQQRSLFDQLVGAVEQRRRHLKPKCRRGLEVDDQLELCRLLDRQIRSLLPLENPASIGANLAITIQHAGSIANQATRLDEISQVIYCGHRVARRQRDDLFIAAVEERIVIDKKRIGPLLDERRKYSVEVAFAAGVYDANLLPDGTSRHLHILYIGFGARIARIDENGDQGGFGHQLAQQLQPLW